MEKKLFDLFDGINRSGIDNGSWGIVEDVKSTVDYFGVVEDIPLDGQYLYVYRSWDEADILFPCKVEPYRTLTIDSENVIDVYSLD